jgi:hypothetical protein
MFPPAASRKEAKSQGNRFYHGKACAKKRGHGTIRLTINGQCYLCQLAATRAWKAKQKASTLHLVELEKWRKIAEEYRNEQDAGRVYKPIKDLNPSTCFIYSLSDPRTGQVRYIGKANDPKIRLYGHIDSRRLLKKTPKNAWLRELIANGLQPTIDILETTDLACWQDREQRWISAMRDAGASLTNITSGGEGTEGYRHSQESKEMIRAASFRMWSNPVFRARMSELMKNRPQDPRATEKRRQGNIAHYAGPGGPERREAISRALKGHTISSQTREKIREALKARYASGMVHPMLGKSHSTHSRQKMSQSALKRDPTTRELTKARAEAISRAKKGWTPKAETRMKMRLAKLGKKRKTSPTETPGIRSDTELES